MSGYTTCPKCGHFTDGGISVGCGDDPMTEIPCDVCTAKAMSIRISDGEITALVANALIKLAPKRIARRI